jgi:hypothetical protein
MLLSGLLRAIQDSPLGQYISGSEWAFPTLESIHVIAITTVFGSIAIMDLRLLGWASGGSKVTQVSHDTLRLTWGAFAVAFITGGLLFTSKAADYSVNPYFVTKMGLILLAGVNMAIFHLLTWRGIARWDSSARPPLGAKLAGGLSLAFWVTAIFLARVVGFTLDKFTAS